MICIKAQMVWRHCSLTCIKTERKSKYCSSLPANETNFIVHSAEALPSGKSFLLIVPRVSAREAELSQKDAPRFWNCTLSWTIWVVRSKSVSLGLNSQPVATFVVEY